MWHVFSGRQAPVLVGAVSLLLILGGCSPALLGQLFSSSQSPSDTSPTDDDDGGSGGGTPVVTGTTVTIARASGQAAKAQALPITFDITFNVPVTGFDASDVTFNGDPAEIAFNVTGSGANYQVVVTAVDRSRKLIPTVQASAAVDSEGVANTTAVTANASQRVDHLPIKFKQITSSFGSGCGLTGDGIIYCWGQSPTQLTTTRFVQVSGGGYSFCALTAEGLAYCWGSDSVGQLGNGAAITADQSTPSPVDMSTVTGGRFVQITTGSWNHACGLTPEGLAYCWGSDHYGHLGNGVGLSDQASPSPVDMGPVAGGKFVYLAAGHHHTCGLTAEGLAYCWGADLNEQLGNGAILTGNQQSPSPVDMGPVAGGKFVQITPSCGLTAEGLAYCWGWDDAGRLGNGAVLTADQESPSPVDMAPLAGEMFTRLYPAGGGHTCGLTASGLAYCWGSDLFGRLGNGAVLTADQESPSPVDLTPLAGEKFAELSAGAGNTCGLTASGFGYCWGGDYSNQLGNGWVLTADQESPSPLMIDTLTSEFAFKQVVTGSSHTCGLTAEGLAYCWGDDANGQLGNGATLTANQSSPSPVDMSPVSGGRFVQLAAGWSSSCGLTAEGLAYCWGSGNDTPSTVDMTPLAGGKFVHLVMGSAHACGLTAEGLAYCWGSDQYGQLGDGAGLTGYQANPSPVDMTPVTGGRFVQLTAGGGTCGLTAEGLAYCWGDDSVGQLGNGAGLTGDQVSPSPVDMTSVSGGRFIQITMGQAHTCGLTADGQAYCWGWDDYGQVGNGSGLTGDQVSPSPVNMTPLAGETFVQLTTGGYHTCGLTAEGLVYCWGPDSYGQTGNGSGMVADQVSPSPVDMVPVTAGKFAQLSDGGGGSVHTCGLTTEGLAYCWGRDQYDEIGNGATTGNQASPSAVDLSEL